MALFNKDPAALNKEWQQALCRVIAQSSLDAFWDADDFDLTEKESLQELYELSQTLHAGQPGLSNDAQDADDLSAVVSKQHTAWFNHLAAVHNEIDFMKAAEIIDNISNL